MIVCVEGVLGVLYTSTLWKKFSFFRVRVAVAMAVGEFSSGSNSVNIPNINLQRNHFNQWPGRANLCQDLGTGLPATGYG